MRGARAIPAAPSRTRRDAWAWGEARLRGAGLEPAAARLEAEVLLRHAGGMSREELLVRPGVELPPEAARAYAGLIHERAAGCPTAYLVGHREFFGLDFLVDRRVLIPRPETERLVEVVRDALTGRPAPLIVDVGTGSGAVAVALAHVLPDACVAATDCSEEALAVARENAARHGVSDRIVWALGPDLRALESGAAARAFGADLAGRVDAVCSNPPYIPSADVARLPVELREHEPRVALDGGPDGLDLVRRLIGGSPRLLRPGGLLALEVAAIPDQARAVTALMAETGDYTPPEIVRDYAGLERVVTARRKADRAVDPSGHGRTGSARGLCRGPA